MRAWACLLARVRIGILHQFGPSTRRAENVDLHERVQPVYRAQILLIGLLLRRLGIAHKQVVQRAFRKLHVVVKGSILGEFRLAAAVKP